MQGAKMLLSEELCMIYHINSDCTPLIIAALYDKPHNSDPKSLKLVQFV